MKRKYYTIPFDLGDIFCNAEKRRDHLMELKLRIGSIRHITSNIESVRRSVMDIKRITSIFRSGVRDVHRDSNHDSSRYAFGSRRGYSMNKSIIYERLKNTANQILQLFLVKPINKWPSKTPATVIDVVRRVDGKLFAQLGLSKKNSMCEPPGFDELAIEHRINAIVLQFDVDSLAHMVEVQRSIVNYGLPLLEKQFYSDLYRDVRLGALHEESLVGMFAAYCTLKRHMMAYASYPIDEKLLDTERTLVGGGVS